MKIDTYNEIVSVEGAIRNYPGRDDPVRIIPFLCIDSDDPSPTDGFCHRWFFIKQKGPLFDGDACCPYCGMEIDVT